MSDEPGGYDPPPKEPPVKPRRTTGARMLGAAMLGLEQALYGEKEERPGIVVDAPGEPPNDLPFDLLLDPEHPERSAVVFRASTDEAPPSA